MLLIKNDSVSERIIKEAIQLLKSKKDVEEIQDLHIKIQYSKKKYEIHLNRHLYE